MTTTADVTALLRACRENAEEDTPRLMLADELTATGFDGAATYIRDSVESFRADVKPKHRQTESRNYIWWLKSVLGATAGICGGETWGSFHWDHSCVLVTERGLPATALTTLPMLMSHAPRMFLFPLTTCRITDRYPEGDRVYEVWGWSRTNWPTKYDTWIDEPEMIPYPVFDRLEGATSNTGYGYRGFAGSAAARKSLRAAALAFGRASVT